MALLSRVADMLIMDQLLKESLEQLLWLDVSVGCNATAVLELAGRHTTLRLRSHFLKGVGLGLGGAHPPLAAFNSMPLEPPPLLQSLSGWR
jgi:hypothetical protein